MVLGFMLFDNAEDNDIQGNVKGNAISEGVVAISMWNWFRKRVTAMGLCTVL